MTIEGGCGNVASSSQSFSKLDQGQQQQQQQQQQQFQSATSTTMEPLDEVKWEDERGNENNNLMIGQCPGEGTADAAVAAALLMDAKSYNSIEDSSHQSLSDSTSWSSSASINIDDADLTNDPPDVDVDGGDGVDNGQKRLTVNNDNNGQGNGDENQTSKNQMLPVGEEQQQQQKRSDLLDATCAKIVSEELDNLIERFKLFAKETQQSKATTTSNLQDCASGASTGTLFSIGDYLIHYQSALNDDVDGDEQEEEEANDDDDDDGDDGKGVVKGDGEGEMGGDRASSLIFESDEAHQGYLEESYDSHHHSVGKKTNKLATTTTTIVIEDDTNRDRIEMLRTDAGQAIYGA